MRLKIILRGIIAGILTGIFITNWLIGIFATNWVEEIFTEIFKAWENYRRLYALGASLGAIFGVFVGIVFAFEIEFEDPSKKKPSFTSFIFSASAIGAIFMAVSGILIALFFGASAGAIKGIFIAISAWLCYWLFDYFFKSPSKKAFPQPFLHLFFGVIVAAFYGALSGIIIANFNGAPIGILIATLTGAFLGAILGILGEAIERIVTKANSSDYLYRTNLRGIINSAIFWSIFGALFLSLNAALPLGLDRNALDRGLEGAFRVALYGAPFGALIGFLVEMFRPYSIYDIDDKALLRLSSGAFSGAIFGVLIFAVSGAILEVLSEVLFEALIGATIGALAGAIMVLPFAPSDFLKIMGVNVFGLIFGSFIGIYIGAFIGALIASLFNGSFLEAFHGIPFGSFVGALIGIFCTVLRGAFPSAFRLPLGFTLTATLIIAPYWIIYMALMGAFIGFSVLLFNEAFIGAVVGALLTVLIASPFLAYSLIRAYRLFREIKEQEAALKAEDKTTIP